MSVSLLLYCFSFVKGVQTLRLPLGIDQISNLISGEKSIFFVQGFTDQYSLPMSGRAYHYNVNAAMV